MGFMTISVWYLKSLNPLYLFILLVYASKALRFFSFKFFIESIIYVLLTIVLSQPNIYLKESLNLAGLFFLFFLKVSVFQDMQEILNLLTSFCVCVGESY